ncbi:MAG: hypothetical protein ACOYM9_13975 [Bradymonadia bacterium]
MDAVTELKVQTALALAVYPLVTLGVLLAVGLKVRATAAQPERPGVLGLALMAALAVSWVGLVGAPSTLPPVDRKLWMPILTLAVPALFFVVERKPRVGVVAPAAALAICLGTWLVLAPVLGGEYAPVSRVATGAALALATWIGLDRAARIVPAPVVLASVCFAAIGAAASSALAGTALMGQALGGVACVAGVASLVVWRLPRLTAGSIAVAAVLVPFLGTVQIATYYGELPPVAAALFAVAPLGALAALAMRRVVPATLVAAAVAAALAAIGAFTTIQAESAKAARLNEGQPAVGNTPDYGKL